MVYHILFVCTGNSCRSQMAEGFANHYGQGMIKAHSAGLEPSQVNPLAIRVMGEQGIDISHHTAKALDPALLAQMDYVITVCSNAEERCPMIPAAIAKEHWPFDDPPHLAAGLSEADALPIYRRVRNEIDVAVKNLVDRLVFAHVAQDCP